MRTYVAAKIRRPGVIRMRSAECGMRNGSSDFRDERWSLGIEPARSIPHSAFRIPHWLYLPIREQHSTACLGLAIALVGHPEVGPADASSAGDNPAVRDVEAGLATLAHQLDALAA